MKRMILVPALGLVLGGVALADNRGDTPGSQYNDTRRSTTPAPSSSEQYGEMKGTLSDGDRQFMLKASQGGVAEIKLGQLAIEKGSAPEVKEFGRRMVKDHTKASNELAQLATRLGVSLPKELSSEDQATYDKLSKLSGQEFDHAYMEAMVEDHDKDVAEFQRISQSGDNGQLRSFASKTLPTLKSHQTMARRDLHMM